MIAVPDLYKEKRRQFMRRDFDLLSLGEILLRLSPPDNERIVRGDTFQDVYKRQTGDLVIKLRLHRTHCG